MVPKIDIIDFVTTATIFRNTIGGKPELLNYGSPLIAPHGDETLNPNVIVYRL